MATIPQDASHDVRTTVQELNDEIRRLRMLLSEAIAAGSQRDPELVTRGELSEILRRPKFLDFRDTYRAAGPAHAIGYVPSDGRWMSAAMPDGHERVLREDAVWRMPQVQGQYVIDPDDPHQKNTLHGHLHVAGGLFSSKVSSGGLDVFGDAEISSNIEAGGDATVVGDADISGDTTLGGLLLLTGSGLPSGSVYGEDIAWSQASAVQNTWYDISDSDIATATAGLVGFTHDGNGQLTATYAGRYLVTYSVSHESSAANIHHELAISVNGTPISDGHTHDHCSSATTEYDTASTAIVDLGATDTIEIAIRTTSVGTPTITVEFINYSVVMIGG